MTSGPVGAIIRFRGSAVTQGRRTLSGDMYIMLPPFSPEILTEALLHAVVAGGQAGAEIPAWLRAWVYAYIGVLLLLCVYGAHRYVLVHLYYKHRQNKPKQNASFVELPHVTVQLPMYNEQYVARRIIEAACRIDYPRDRLHVQVLDDSTDETVDIARQAADDMRNEGFDVAFLHRDNRAGYKAGALEAGLAVAGGEFVAIFDADFVPPPDILKRTIHYFTDDRVGMVQARWEHINRDNSLLTKSQAILLDGHFMIEHAARNRSGRFMSFNGTAGLWRKQCIGDAGGWEHDTLTEDLDLSYRAQMKGWRFVFLPEVTSPAELPPDMMGFRQQQARWAKGGAQTMVKLLPKVLASRLPAKIKLEAFFHLTSSLVYILMVLLTLLLAPAIYLKFAILPQLSWERALFDVSMFALATCGASTFYLVSQYEIFHTWTDKVKFLPFLMALGIGISLNNAKAVIEGLLGHQSEFVRTPKFGVNESDDEGWKGKRKSFAKKFKFMPYLELLFGLYMVGCVVACLRAGVLSIGIPFVCLFAAGYFYVGLLTLQGNRKSAPRQAEPAPAPVTRDPAGAPPSGR